MSVFDYEIVPAPSRAAPSMDGASLPIDACRWLEGIFPARLGVQKPAPVPKHLLKLVPRHATEQIQGYAVYKPQFATLNLADFLVFTDRNLYIFPIFATAAQGLAGVDYDFLYYRYNLTPRGQSATIAYHKNTLGVMAAQQGFPDFSTSTDWAADQATGSYNNIASVQFDNELIFHCPGLNLSLNSMWRYYQDEDGLRFLYSLYVPAGGAPTVTAGVIDTGILNGIYAYIWTVVDSLGNESQVSPQKYTSNQVNQAVTVTQGPITAGATNPLVSWNIYRFHLDSPVTTINWYKVVNLPIATTTYLDNLSDAAVVANGIIDTALFASSDPPAGGIPALLNSTGVLTGTYQYEWTWVDEQGREGSPSESVEITGLALNSVTVTRGATTLFTATGSIRYWNLYRRNPGAAAFNRVAQIAYGTTTYVDNISDPIVLGGAVAPDAGENDEPDTGTYLTVHKNRLVMNSLFNYGVIQISNAGDPTHFSSITLPTNTSSGLRLQVGDDADNVITGLESIGDLLWIAKPISYYLLQGDDITSWNLQQVGKARGCDNFFTVQRTEELVLFKSGDGIYSLSYQAGMISPNLSWEIAELFSGFSSVLTPLDRDPQPFGGVYTPAPFDGNTAGQPISTAVGSRYINWTRSFYWQQRYFLCGSERTLVFDMLNKGWGDSGLGPIKWATVFDGIQPVNVTGEAVGGLPESVFFSYGGAFDSNLMVYYFTSADTCFDADLPTTYKTGPIGREITRSFSSTGMYKGAPQSKRKRGARFILFGRTGRKPGTILGWITAFADGRRCGPRIPIRAYSTINMQGALFECGLPSQMVGQELYVLLEWIISDWECGNKMLKYVELD